MRIFHTSPAPTLAAAILLSVFVPASVVAADSGRSAEDSAGGAESTAAAPLAPGLTGDWGGLRTRMNEHGIKISTDLTSFYQGVISGGRDKEWRFLETTDLKLDVDTGQAGLWPGGFFRVSAEGRFGNDVNRKSGTFSPVNAAAILPADPDNLGQDMFAITELTMTQFLSKKFGLFAGLLNTASGDANDYAGFLRSKEHFQNLSFLANAVALRLVPNVALGGGVVLIPTDGILGTVAFINTEEAAGQDPFDNSNGGTLMTEWQLEHELADMPLHHVVAFGYGFDNDFFRLGEFPRLGIPPGGGPPTLEFSTKDDSWAAWYNGALQFWTDVRDKQRNAGVFVRFGYADEDTNPIQWNAAIGVGAVGAADFRPLDRFGIGLYRLKPVDAFPLPALGVDEETGFEAFYCYQITPAVALTADLQYVDSGLGTGTLVTNDTDNAWVGGLRLNLVL